MHGKLFINRLHFNFMVQEYYDQNIMIHVYYNIIECSYKALYFVTSQY